MAQGGNPVGIPMDIFERVSALCLALPEVTVRVDESRVKWRSTAYSFDIRRRSFCLLIGTEDATGVPVPGLVLRAHPDDRDVLVSIGHPYVASRASHDHVRLLLNDDTDWEVRAAACSGPGATVGKPANVATDDSVIVV